MSRNGVKSTFFLQVFESFLQVFCRLLGASLFVRVFFPRLLFLAFCFSNFSAMLSSLFNCCRLSPCSNGTATLLSFSDAWSHDDAVVLHAESSESLNDKMFSLCRYEKVEDCLMECTQNVADDFLVDLRLERDHVDKIGLVPFKLGIVWQSNRIVVVGQLRLSAVFIVIE